MVPKITSYHTHGFFRGFVKDSVYVPTLSKTSEELKAWINCWHVQKLPIFSRKCGRSLSINLTLLGPLELNTS
jgi:hypothetical protein